MFTIDMLEGHLNITFKPLSHLSYYLSDSIIQLIYLNLLIPIITIIIYLTTMNLPVKFKHSYYLLDFTFLVFITI